MSSVEEIIHDIQTARRLKPLYLVEALPQDPDIVVSEASEQVKSFLEQDDLKDEEKAKVFSDLLVVFGSFALDNPNLVVEVEWLDEHGLPQPMKTTPTDAIRRTASRNINEVLNI